MTTLTTTVKRSVFADLPDADPDRRYYWVAMTPLRAPVADGWAPTQQEAQQRADEAARRHTDRIRNH